VAVDLEPVDVLADVLQHGSTLGPRGERRTGPWSDLAQPAHGLAPSSARRTVCAASRSVDLLVTRLSGGTVDPERALDEVQARGDLGQLGQQLVLVG